MANDLEALLAGALSGAREATSAFIRAALPIVQVRSARALVGRMRGQRSVRQEVEDLTQDAMAALFAHDARALRGWDPARGLSLANYVGLVTEREALRVLRSRARSPWADDPAPGDAIERSAGTTGSHHAAFAAQNLFDRIWAQLARELSPRGIDLFERLVIDEQPIDRVCEELGMRPDAAYAWRSRLLKRARVIAGELDSDAKARVAASNDSTEVAP